jgi:hypothetical protein
MIVATVDVAAKLLADETTDVPFVVNDESGLSVELFA